MLESSVAVIGGEKRPSNSIETFDPQVGQAISYLSTLGHCALVPGPITPSSQSLCSPSIINYEPLAGPNYDVVFWISTSHRTAPNVWVIIYILIMGQRQDFILMIKFSWTWLHLSSQPPGNLMLLFWCRLTGFLTKKIQKSLVLVNQQQSLPVVDNWSRVDHRSKVLTPCR